MAARAVTHIDLDPAIRGGVVINHLPMFGGHSGRRGIDVAVAGEAALINPKLHKLHDRLVQNHAHRRHNKDAGDIVRLMRVTSPGEIGATLVRLAEDDVAGPAT